MAENKYNVPQISAETLAAIRRKSAYNLPDRPSERGMKPDEIKKAIAGPVTDSENSAIAELMRVIGDINRVLKLIETEGSGVSVTQISGGKRLTVTTEEGESHIDIVESYSKEQIDAMMGSYVNDIAQLIGGEALADS